MSAARHGKSARRRRRRGEEDEPDRAQRAADGAGLVEEWGGELWFVVDHTPGGAPIGVPLAELERDDLLTSTAEWARAKRLLARTFAGATTVVGRVRHLGEGLSRSAWIAEVAAAPAFEGAAVVLLPHDDVDAGYAGRVRREAALLATLARKTDLPFRVPRPLALLVDGDRPALVEQHVRGLPLDLRADRGQKPWRVIGQLAAAVHALDVAAPGPATTRDAALARIAALAPERERHSLVAAALDFATARLPEAGRPTALLHGDLLGQNIRLPFDGEERPALIDFEHAARGDPADELAIVTRGVRRPFGVADGLARLLAAYAAAGGRAVRESEVHVFEALLLAGLIVSSLRRTPHAVPPELQTLAALLARA